MLDFIIGDSVSLGGGADMPKIWDWQIQLLGGIFWSGSGVELCGIFM